MGKTKKEIDSKYKYIPYTENGLTHTDENVVKESSFDMHDVDQQSWIQRHALQLFVFNFSTLQFVQMVFYVYYIAVVRTIEKRYGLTSTSTGMIMSLNDVLHTSVVIFIGYFGRKGHKPIIIGGTSIFLCVSAFLYALPYFLYGAEDFGDISNGTLTAHQTEQQYCEAKNSSDECSNQNRNSRHFTNNSVVYILCIASALAGFGGCALNVLGTAYVDQNADKTDSAFYMGIITSTFSLGPICGIILGAICLAFPENLQDTEKTPEDPTWIGAWWLGYVLCSLLLFVLTIPMFFFPKHITPPVMQTEHTGDTNSSFLDQIKEFPKAMLDLLRNKAFLFLLVTGILSVYVIDGVFLNMPRYFEIHYHMPAFKANIGAALPGMAGVVGGFFGGIIMKHYKFDSVDMVKMLIFALAVTSVGIVTAMFITCPQINMAGEWNADHTSVSVEQACNANCSCELSKNTYHPVCAADGLTHYSPCYAGCSSASNINGTVYYDNCACMDGTGQSGACVEPCTVQFYAFAVLMLIMSFLSSLGRVPGIIVQFRIVGKDEGSFALAITSFMINLLGLIPGPILFGSLVDSTCVLWQYSCGKRGACLFYDTNHFRYKIFGVSFLFQVLSAPFAFGMLWAVKKMTLEEKKVAREEAFIIKAPKERKEALLEKVSGV